MTLAEWSEGRSNNLDLLRLIGALLVIFAHAFPIAGLPNRRPPFYRAHYGTLGVDIFFIISGYLITQSYFRSRSAWHFTSARVLRVFPALVTVTLLLTLVAGPLLSTLSAADYFEHPWTWSYPRGAISLYEVTRFTVLPGVFMSNPIVQANGPLWTLQYEWTFYFVILGLGVVRLLERRGVMVALFIASLLMSHFDLGAGRTLYFTPVDSIFKFFAYFSFGALAYLYRAEIPMVMSLFATAVGILVASPLWGGMADVPFVFVMGYFILFVGLNPRLHLGSLTRGSDYSYGLYLWGWPCQQTVFYLTGAATSVWMQLTISVLLAFVMAAASWNLVEKRALALKPRHKGARHAHTAPGVDEDVAPSTSGDRTVIPVVAALGLAMALLLPRLAITESPVASGIARLGDGAWAHLAYESADAANRGRFDDAFARDNGYRIFATNGTAKFGPFESSAGVVRVRVEAAASMGGGRYSELVIEVHQLSGQLIDRRTLKLTGERKGYEFDVPLKTAEAHGLHLVFLDDFYAEGNGDRNVIIFDVSMK